jgi:hypothetical protein
MIDAKIMMKEGMIRHFQFKIETIENDQDHAGLT